MNDSKKQKEVYEETISNWLEGFKDESVSEEKRITDFQMSGWSCERT